MNNFVLITTKIVPRFLEKTKYNYVVLGGKAYQYYFKDIKSDDWDIVLDYDPEKFLIELQKELNKENIFDLDFSFAEDVNGEKIYQMGLKSYKGPDYEERFFIDIKQSDQNDIQKKYEPIKINGIMVASLKYLYNDGLETLYDRKKDFKNSSTDLVTSKTIKTKIDYFKSTIKFNILSNLKFIINFHKNILPDFKDGPFKKNLDDYLNKFIEYYGEITIDTIDKIKINDSLEEKYNELYDDKLFKYDVDDGLNKLKGKKLEVYKFINAIDKFIEEKKQYNKRNDIIKSHKTFLKEQNIIADRIKTKYFKSFRRKQAFMNIINNLDTSVFTKHFLTYIKSHCKNNNFEITLGKDNIIKIPCKKYTLTRRYSNTNILTKKSALSQNSNKSKKYSLSPNSNKSKKYSLSPNSNKSKKYSVSPRSNKSKKYSVSPNSNKSKKYTQSYNSKN